MALRTPNANGLAVPPNAVASPNDPAASTEELQAHRFWGRYTAATALPNAVGNAAADPAYSLMRPGDVAWVQANGLLYQLQDRGTLNGSDAIWVAVGGELRSQGVSGYTDAVYYSAPANSLPGHVNGFLVAQLVRVIGPVSGGGQGAGLCCYQLFAGDGGYHMSFGPDTSGSVVRAIWGIGQQSDGQVIQNGFAGNLSYDPFVPSGPWWRQYGRLYLQVLAYDGANAVGYLNGEIGTTLGPAGGYQVPNAAFTPFIGRNTNPGSPTPLEGVEVIGCGYLSDYVATEQEVIDTWLATLEAGTFVDWQGVSGFDSLWTFQGETAPPPLLADQGAGGVDFTLSAPGLTLANRISYF